MSITPLRALIVEHDRADAELIVETLERADFRVDADMASTPDDFRRLVLAHEYDVVLADFRLPSWTGMDALRDLRALGLDTPLILVTGTLGDERAVECVKAGAADYVLKDNIGRLRVAVHRALLEHHSRRELARAATQTREFEAQALEREARFTQLADTISEVFYLVGSDFSRTLFINKAFEAIWGRPVQSQYDNPRSFLDGVHADDRQMLVDYIARVQRGELTGHLDFRVVRPAGDVRWVTSRAVPILDDHGAVYRISGVVLDVTERRAARDALQESEARFRKLVDAAFDGIVITQRGIVREVNRGFLDMFALSSDTEAVGRPAVDFTAPESRDLVAQRMRDGEEGTYDSIAQRPNGTTFVVEATARDHEVDGAKLRITALRDVTHQRTLEEQFRQAQKMEAVGRLAGGVAHDFNNLLTVISSSAEFLRSDMSPQDPRMEDADEILKAAATAASLTRQLLAFSRQEVIRPRAIGLNQAIGAVEKMLRRLIGEDVTLVTALDQRPLMIYVDQGQFEQMIMNIVVNARDAMPTGGTLTIRTSEATFDGNPADPDLPSTAGQFALIAITDSGVGMDAPTRLRIFEPFFTTKEIGKGTGLGLATVYGTMRQSGGFITVDTAPGRGTTFNLYFPLIESVPAGHTPAHVVPLPRGTERILIAEDASSVRTAARRILERQGYVVLEAPRGSVALDIAQREHPDLLLTDVVMPEMSGRELAERFSSLCPRGKVLYMSGYTDDAVLRHGVLSSGVEFIQKPFSSETLARKVRAVLDNSTAS